LTQLQKYTHQIEKENLLLKQQKEASVDVGMQCEPIFDID